MSWNPVTALLFVVALSSFEFEMRGMSCRSTSDVTDVPSRSALLQRSNQHDDTDIDSWPNRRHRYLGPAKDGYLEAWSASHARSFGGNTDTIHLKAYRASKD